MRYLLRLSEFDFTTTYRPGRVQLFPDALSGLIPSDGNTERTDHAEIPTYEKLILSSRIGDIQWSSNVLGTLSAPRRRFSLVRTPIVDSFTLNLCNMSTSIKMGTGKR